MADEGSTIKIHVLHCGSMLVSKAVPYGGGVNLKNVRRGVFDKLSKRIELPVSAYLGVSYRASEGKGAYRHGLEPRDKSRRRV